MKWIRIEDRLPENKDDVLIYGISTFYDVDCNPYKRGIIDIGYRSRIDNPDNPTKWADSIFPVTHWMPLPEPPK